MNDDNLWPNDLIESIPETPKGILDLQAMKLRDVTKGLVLARVDTRAHDGGNIEHRFSLIVPSLRGYRYTLFEFYHDEGLYPVSCEGESFENEEHFRDGLRALFSNQRTVKIIRALVAQAMANTAQPQAGLDPGAPVPF